MPLVARSISFLVWEKSYGDPASGHSGRTMMRSSHCNSFIRCRAISKINACNAFAIAPTGGLSRAQAYP